MAKYVVIRKHLSWGQGAMLSLPAWFLFLFFLFGWFFLQWCQLRDLVGCECPLSGPKVFGQSSIRCEDRYVTTFKQQSYSKSWLLHHFSWVGAMPLKFGPATPPSRWRNGQAKWCCNLVHRESVPVQGSPWRTRLLAAPAHVREGRLVVQVEFISYWYTAPAKGGEGHVISPCDSSIDPTLPPARVPCSPPQLPSP